MWYCITAFIVGAAAASLIAWRLAVRWTHRYAERQKQLLQRTRRAEKLAELGTLAGHLAHEIRNPLSIIKLNLQLLSEDIARLDKQTAASDPDSADAARLGELRRIYQRQLKKLQTVTGETDRLADTLNDFLRYAGKMELRPTRQNVNEILDDLMDFYEPQAISKNIRLRRSLCEEPALCRVDADLFKQAMLNLFINAAQAMDNGGELIVKTAMKPSEVQIDVIDTGPGIPPDRREKIFGAYYTTRPGGTGLGLPTCRRIIEEHNGRIELHSEPGKGSNFAIHLPLIKET
jgi:signal transduction histidine kinase